ncbi:MAG: hypothetical protein ACYS0E_19780 [Planctomycetota bacterium]
MREFGKRGRSFATQRFQHLGDAQLQLVIAVLQPLAELRERLREARPHAAQLDPRVVVAVAEALK